MTTETGDQAPDFTLCDHTNSPVSLGDFAGARLLLYFYPKAATPGCTTQACDLRDRHEVLAEAGCKIVGISPDPTAKLLKFHTDHKLSFPLLSDQDHAVAAAYGAWGLKKNYGREYEGLIRSTFLIGSTGLVEQAWRNVRAAGHGDRMVREVGRS